MDIIGESTAFQDVMHRLERIAPSDATVLLQGETGTGKGLFAQIIHAKSPRSDRPFIVVDCSTISSSLLESELFGHVRGAFTGAVETTTGLFREAEGGTIFLDEIAEIPYALQAKFLRAIELKEIRSVGGYKNFQINARIIAATSQRLETLIRERLFREDLYYRLKVVSLYIPPLRDRKEDIPLLVSSFMHAHNVEKIFSPEAMDKLSRYSWPGNVRELKQLVEYCVLMGKEKEVFDLNLLPVKFRNGFHLSQCIDGSLKSKTKAFERGEILNALDKYGWEIGLTARFLGITPQGLRKKMHKHSIERIRQNTSPRLTTEETAVSS